MKEALTKRFVLPSREVYKVVEFRSSIQKPDVDALFSALRSLIKKCGYASAAVEKRLMLGHFATYLHGKAPSTASAAAPIAQS